MAQIEVFEGDINKLKNILSALKKGKWDGLEGPEILAFAQAFGWLGELMGRINKGLAPAPVEPQVPTIEAETPPKKKKSKAE